MKTFTGTLTLANQIPVNVSGAWRDRSTPGGNDDWEGWIERDDGGGIQVGIQVLILSNGQTTRIMVKSVGVSPSGGIRATFEGAGGSLPT